MIVSTSSLGQRLWKSGYTVSSVVMRSLDGSSATGQPEALKDASSDFFKEPTFREATKSKLRFRGEPSLFAVDCFSTSDSLEGREELAINCICG